MINFENLNIFISLTTGSLLFPSLAVLLDTIVWIIEIPILYHLRDYISWLKCVIFICNSLNVNVWISINKIRMTPLVVIHNQMFCVLICIFKLRRFSKTTVSKITKVKTGISWANQNVQRWNRSFKRKFSYCRRHVNLHGANELKVWTLTLHKIEKHSFLCAENQQATDLFKI